MRKTDYRISQLSLAIAAAFALQGPAQAQFQNPAAAGTQAAASGDTDSSQGGGDAAGGGESGGDVEEIATGGYQTLSPLFKGIYFVIVVGIFFVILSVRDCLNKRRAGEPAIAQVEYTKLNQREDIHDVEQGLAEETWEEDWTDLPESSPSSGINTGIHTAGFSRSDNAYSATPAAPSSSFLGQQNSSGRGGGSNQGTGTGSGSIKGLGGKSITGLSSNNNNGNGGRVSESESYKSTGPSDFSSSLQRNRSTDSARSTSSTPPPTGTRAISKPPPPGSSSDTDFFAVSSNDVDNDEM